MAEPCVEHRNPHQTSLWRCDFYCYVWRPEFRHSSGGGNGGLTAGTAYVWLCVLSETFSIDSFTMDTVPSLPFGGTPATVPGLIEAEEYDMGGQGVAYNDTTIENSGNVSVGIDGAVCVEAAREPCDTCVHGFDRIEVIGVRASRPILGRTVPHQELRETDPWAFVQSVWSLWYAQVYGLT